MKRNSSKLLGYVASFLAAIAPAYAIATLDRNKSTIEDKISQVHRSSMPEGVAGDYRTDNGNIRVDESLPEDYKMFVTRHEVAHGEGYRDEFQTDCRAASETGKPEYVRGPWYRAPLIFDPSTRKQNYRFN